VDVIFSLFLSPVDLAAPALMISTFYAKPDDNVRFECCLPAEQALFCLHGAPFTPSAHRAILSLPPPLSLPLSSLTFSPPCPRPPS
jgi:hypothetical protein